MGLHADVKKYLRGRFPEAVNAEIPKETCDVQIVDLMWLLFKFFPDDDANGHTLIDFFWNPIERFFDAGGKVYVCVFDAPGLVPIAKAEEHKKRYGGVAVEPLESHACDDNVLPAPWRAALANRSVRATVCAYVADGVLRRFTEAKSRFPKRELYVSGLAGRVDRADDSGIVHTDNHAAVTRVGEGDLAVAYWAQQYHDRATIVRVLDSDQIPILQMRAHIARRRAPLFIWLVTPRKQGVDLPYHGYTSMPFEAHTLVDVPALNQAVTRAGLRVEEFCFQVICQKTDFVDKVISNLGVEPSMVALEKNASHAITVTASAARFDATLVKQSFSRAARSSKRKRAEVRADGDVEFRRAWWTLCYWSFGWQGALSDALRPRPAFGFDAKGARTAKGCREAYPSV
jgi:hypothetical protein